MCSVTEKPRAGRSIHSKSASPRPSTTGETTRCSESISPATRYCRTVETPPPILTSLPCAACFALSERSRDRSLTVWIYQELCRAIASGRLRPGTRLPSTRQFAQQHGISRGTAVTVFEQLKSEGYLRSGKRAGTWINPRLANTKECACQRIANKCALLTRPPRRFTVLISKVLG